MSSLSDSKTSSLQWAIDELSKQREALDAKLKVALKRDETQALIDEVMAQRKALEKRISALEDGLKASSDLVDVPCDELESEMQKIDEKLDIAKERLHTIEQEEYLEELGKSLNRTNPDKEDPSSSLSIQPDTSSIEDLGLVPPVEKVSSTSSSPTTHFSAESEVSDSASVFTQAKPMKASNRLPNQEVQTEESSTTVTVEQPESLSKQSVLSLEETAKHLGIEPDFLTEKAMNAILRMIARNGGKLTFPLEVDQID